MPAQKPVAVTPDVKLDADRTLVMKVTIQPPSETTLRQITSYTWEESLAFGANVSKNEHSKDPCYFVFDSVSCTTTTAIRVDWIFKLVNMTGLFPKHN
jgi:hypothetical protein